MGPNIQDTISLMRRDWNLRALENAEYYVQNQTGKWEQREFFRSGEINVANEVMPDMINICGGQRSPLDLRVLEIGCGVGRMTRMLARIFGYVTAVDISDEMLARAAVNTADLSNVELRLCDGATLSGLSDSSFDFVFSFIVFQHIPLFEIIKSYCREVCRVLRPGGLFKFQVQGDTSVPPDDRNTWLGCSVSAKQAEYLAEETGFAVENSRGAGTQYYWLWFRKR